MLVCWLARGGRRKVNSLPPGSKQSGQRRAETRQDNLLRSADLRGWLKHFCRWPASVGREFELRFGLACWLACLLAGSLAHWLAAVYWADLLEFVRSQSNPEVREKYTWAKVRQKCELENWTRRKKKHSTLLAGLYTKHFSTTVASKGDRLTLFCPTDCVVLNKGRPCSLSF